MQGFLNDAPLPVVSVLIFLGLLVARELGAWLRRLWAPGAPDDDAEQGYVLSGVFGLLALLVAFTFGLALDRYETRRDLVVAEANAIGTAEMRVRLLDAPHAGVLTAQFRAYAETRLAYGQAEAADKPPLERRSEALRSAIQAETLVAVQPIRTTPLAALVVSAVNEALDVGAAREAAHAARLPFAVLAVLIAYALISAGVLGAAMEGAHGGRRGMTALMFLLLTLALSLILDLDRPQRGTIRISQEPMARLVAGLQATPPPSAGSPPSPATPASPGAGGSSRP